MRVSRWVVPCLFLLPALAAVLLARRPATAPAGTSPPPVDRVRVPRAGELTAAGEIVGLAGIPGGPVVPVLGITTDRLRDSFGAPRSDERRHTGIDIVAPRGTPIGAAVDGWIYSLSSNDAGGIGLVQIDRSLRYRLYYGHLDRYAEPMYAGRAVRRGELIGYLGDTGNARGTPHLHFEVARITRSDSSAIAPLNPYLFLTGRIRG